MKKILIFVSLFIFTSAVYAEQYTFPAGKMNDADIVIKYGTLNITTAKVKDVVVDISPDKNPNTDRRIYLFKEGRKLKAFLDDADMDAETVVNITFPRNIELDIEAYNATVNIDGMTNDLEIEAMNSKVQIADFRGNFDLNMNDSSVKADGMFKEIDVKSYGGNAEFNMTSVPSWHDYEFEGDGSIVINLSEKDKGKNLNLDTKKFRGSINVR